MSAAVALPMPDGRVHLTTLSQSAITCFRRCAREFEIRYVRKRRPRRTDEALRFGSFFHVGLNAWWGAGYAYADRHVAPDVRLEAALEAMRERAEQRPEDADPFELVKAEELMLGYTARWGEEQYETLAVEQTFDVALVNPQSGRSSKTYRMQGAIDVIARRLRDGRIIQVEHKTTSNDITPGSDYWRKVSALDPQVSTYQAAMRALGHEGVETLYDVVRKVTLRPSKATPEESRKYKKDGTLYANQRETDETPEEFRIRVREHIAENPERYYGRGPIVRLEHDEAEHARDVWQTAAMIRMSELSKSFPRSPNACERFHRLCDYFDVCSGIANIDDDSRFRTAEHAHEELVPKEV